MVKQISCQSVLVALLVVILTSSQMTVSLRRIEKLAALALIANAGAFGGSNQKFIPVPVYVGGNKGKDNHHEPQQKVLQPIIITGCGAGHGQYPHLGLGGGAIGGAHGVW